MHASRFTVRTASAALGLLGFLAIYSIASSFLVSSQGIRTTLSLSGPPGRYAATPGYRAEFRGANTVVHPRIKEASEHRLALQLPPAAVDVISYRLPDGAHDYFIRELCFVSARETSSHCLRGEALLEGLRPRQSISYFRMQGSELHIRTTGKLPRFETTELVSDWLLLHSEKSALLLSLAICAVLASMVFLFRSRLSSLTFAMNGWEMQILACCVLVTFCYFFYSVTIQISRSTPIFMGTDEPAHFAKFLEHTSASSACGELTEPYAQWNDALVPLRHAPERRFSSAILETAPEVTPRLEKDACRYHDVYVFVPRLIRELLYGEPEGGALQSFHKLRTAFSLSALGLFLSSLVLILYGRAAPIAANTPGAYRQAGLLTVLTVAFLPQTLWLSATLSQDYFLIACGVFLACSLGFRLPILSETLFAFSLLVGWSKGAYLLPFLVLILTHYYFFFAKAVSAGRLLCVGIFGFFVLLSTLVITVHSYCQSAFCYGLERGGLSEGVSGFLNELWLMLREHQVLSFPSTFFKDSAFGVFGWLDTPLPHYFANMYSLSSNLALYTVVLVLPLLLVGTSGKILLQTKGLQSLLAAICGYYLYAFLSVYLIFMVMQNWCGDTSFFGCGYQHRYELPLYPALLFGMYVGALLSLRLAFDYLGWDALKDTIFILFLFLQISAAIIVLPKQLAYIQDRFFENSDALARYQASVDGLEAISNSGTIKRD